MWRDIQFAFRILVKSPAFTLVAVLSIALGIGANATIFSLTNALLLRPLPVYDPGRLVRVHSTLKGDGYYNLSYEEYLYYCDHNGVFTSLAAYFPTIPMALAVEQLEPETVTGEIVSGNYFSVLGVTPIYGRAFLPEEDSTPETHPVVILSNKLWRSRFASDPGAVGKIIRLNGHPFTVIGIAPSSFHGTFSALVSELWVPLSMNAQVRPGTANLKDRDSRLLMGIGRLRPNISRDQARANLSTLARQLEQANPSTNKDRGVSVAPMNGLHPALMPIVSGFLALLMAVVGVTLLIACTNLANLLLARGIARRREIAVRLALGASRRRLVQQLITESVLLACLGGAAGTLLSLFASRALIVFKPPLPFPIELDLGPDFRVLGFALVCSLITGVVFGLVPALQTSRPELTPALKEAGSLRGYRRSRLRDLFIIAQVSLSMVLLFGAGLLLRSLGNTQNIDPGLDPRQVTVVSFDPGLLGYNEVRGKTFYTALTERAALLPGVESVALGEFVPLSGRGDSLDLVLQGHEPPPEEPGISVGYNVVSPRYFETLRVSLLAGRGFTERDHGDVVIINKALASRLIPLPAARPDEALGKRLRITGRNGNELEIVGVAQTGKYVWLGEEPRPFIYLPFAGNYQSDMTLHLRSREGAPDSSASLIAALRKEVHSLAPDLPLTDIRSVRESMSFALTPARLAGTILSISGFVALLLAAVWVYGVVSYAVSQRTHEVGIRMALGARPLDVMRQILSHGMKLAIIGIVIGSGLSLLAARTLRGLLYGVQPHDPLTMLATALMLICVAALANYFPARRAMRVDPMVALRHE